jgi:SAM-dependent methyltransferase
MTSGDVTDFYDQLAEGYHLIFTDWETAIARQAEVIERLLAGHERQVRWVLDAACGVGTQALGLAAAGYDVTATDVSERSVERCAREAAARGLPIKTQVAVRHFLLDGCDGAWQVAERRVTYRALRRGERTSALDHAGFTNVAWLMPEDTGFYQPVVTAHAE